MGEPATPTPQERAEVRQLAAAVLEAVEGDESVTLVAGVSSWQSGGRGVCEKSDVDDVLTRLSLEIRALEGERADMGDIGTLLHCSIRYAMGRMTYIVGDVIRMVRAYYERCSDSERNNLFVSVDRELKLAGERGKYLGDQYNHGEWTALWAWMRERVPTQKAG